MNIDNWLSRKNTVIALSILFLFIAIPRIIFPDLDHGDEYSDADALSSGENFVKFGFIKTRFLQMREPHLDKPENLYTHYPGLPDIINGFLRKVFKTDSLYFFRGISLLFAYLGVLLWYFFIKRKVLIWGTFVKNLPGKIFLQVFSRVVSSKSNIPFSFNKLSYLFYEESFIAFKICINQKYPVFFKH